MSLSSQNVKTQSEQCVSVIVHCLEEIFYNQKTLQREWCTQQNSDYHPQKPEAMRYPYRKYCALYFMQIKPFIPTIRIIQKQTDLQLNSAEWCYLKIGNSGCCVPFWGLRRNLPASLLKLVHGTGHADKTCRLA